MPLIPARELVGDARSVVVGSFEEVTRRRQETLEVELLLRALQKTDELHDDVRRAGDRESVVAAVRHQRKVGPTTCPLTLSGAAGWPRPSDHDGRSWSTAAAGLCHRPRR